MNKATARWIPFRDFLFLLLVSTFSQCSSTAQTIDCVNIYVVNYDKTLLTEWVANANYVRVNYDYCTHFREKSMLRAFEAAYSSVNYSGTKKERSQDNSGSRVVVDLIRGGRIYETLVFDRSYRMKRDVVYDTYDTWDMDCAFIRHLHTIVPQELIPIPQCR